MKTKLLAVMLLAASAAFGRTNISIGIGVNSGPAYGGYYPAPPPPPPPVMYMPPAPGPGYLWVPGYYAYVGGRYRWNNGYWNRQAYGAGYPNGNAYGYRNNNRGGRGRGRH